jgi:hypothetical protein
MRLTLSCADQLPRPSPFGKNPAPKTNNDIIFAAVQCLNGSFWRRAQSYLGALFGINFIALVTPLGSLGCRLFN